MDIQDRIALVTGAGVGTGKAISKRLAAGGAAVALTDVSDAAVDFAVDTFGGLDILVSNAGGISYDTPGFPHAEPLTRVRRREGRADACHGLPR